MKNDEFSDLYYGADSDTKPEEFVSECTIESDLEILFPANYVPQESERISLYQELDNMERETDIRQFCERLEDRFGRIPHEAMELIRVVRFGLYPFQNPSGRDYINSALLTAGHNPDELWGIPWGTMKEKNTEVPPSVKPEVSATPPPKPIPPIPPK